MAKASSPAAAICFAQGVAVRTWSKRKLVPCALKCFLRMAFDLSLLKLTTLRSGPWHHPHLDWSRTRSWTFCDMASSSGPPSREQRLSMKPRAVCGPSV